MVGLGLGVAVAVGFGLGVGVDGDVVTVAVGVGVAVRRGVGVVVLEPPHATNEPIAIRLAPATTRREEGRITKVLSKMIAFRTGEDTGPVPVVRLRGTTSLARGLVLARRAS